MTPPVRSLPDSMPLADYMAQIKPMCLTFGVDTSGRLLQTPLSESYHLLASGRTRSGKSNNLNLILTQLHYQQRHARLHVSIAVLDFKRELSNIWSRSPLVELSTHDPMELIAYLIGLIVSEVLRLPTPVLGALAAAVVAGLVYRKG